MSVVRKATVMGKRENRGTKVRDLPLLTSNALDISHAIHDLCKAARHLSSFSSKLINFRAGAKPRLTKLPTRLIKLQD